MKTRPCISALLLAATVALAETNEQSIQRVTLDERAVVTVPVATNRVTTLSFPGPIAAIDAVGVTADGKTPGQFQLAHTKGSTFVSVRALARKASALGMVVIGADPALGAKGGVTCFLVDKEAPGLSVGRVHTCMGFTGFQSELMIAVRYCFLVVTQGLPLCA